MQIPFYFVQNFIAEYKCFSRFYVFLLVENPILKIGLSIFFRGVDYTMLTSFCTQYVEMVIFLRTSPHLLDILDPLIYWHDFSRVAVY